MKGVIFTGDRKAEIREFPTPEPGPGEVRVRMKTSSICGTDMHFYRKSWEDLVAFREVLGGSPDTITGHEPCGVVEETGAGVRAVLPGDRVSVYPHIGCGTCRFCRLGDVMFCPERGSYGTKYNGSAADCVIAPERNCLSLSDAIDFEKAAVLACVGSTAYQSIERVEASGEDTMGIFGLGPVGLCAVAFAAARGARVIGVDLVPERLELAQRLGAWQVIDASDGDPAEMALDLTDGKGISAGADYSGHPRAQEAMMACAGKYARLALVGVGEKFQVDTFQGMIMKQMTLTGSWLYNIGLYEEVVDFVLEKELPLERLITHRFRIDHAIEAFELFDSGKCGKVLFTWD